MTGLSRWTCRAFGASLGASLLGFSALSANAQCATCATPTVAYSPVVAAPTVTYTPVDRWYPGRLLDRLRLRRWSVATPAAPVYAAAYTPYTAAYTPYTAAYAPAATYTAAYTPYVTAYAPLQRAVVQTSYLPVAAAEGCSSCAQTSYSPVITTAYAPSTVYQPAVLTPVETPCSACAPCAPAVGQAVYSEPVGDACSSCAASAPVNYADAGGYATQGGVIVGPPTPQPGLTPEEAVPDASKSPYGTNRPEAAAGANGGGVPGTPVDPGPAAEENGAAPNGDASTFYDFQAPPLIGPTNDRTANRPTVKVRNAVYRGPARSSQVSTTAAKPAVSAKTPATAVLRQAEIDAEGWASVPRN